MSSHLAEERSGCLVYMYGVHPKARSTSSHVLYKHEYGVLSPPISLYLTQDSGMAMVFHPTLFRFADDATGTVHMVVAAEVFEASLLCSWMPYRSRKWNNDLPGPRDLARLLRSSSRIVKPTVHSFSV